MNISNLEGGKFHAGEIWSNILENMDMLCECLRLEKSSLFYWKKKQHLLFTERQKSF